MIASAAAKAGNVLEKEETGLAADILTTGVRRLGNFWGANLLPQIVGQGFGTPRVAMLAFGFGVFGQMKTGIDEANTHANGALVVPSLIAGLLLGGIARPK